MGRFLRGELPPLKARRDELLARPAQSEHDRCFFAERLALALRFTYQLPLAVVTRFGGGQDLLMNRPPGPWLTELEALFGAPDDEGGARPGHTACAVWAAGAPVQRKLRHLEVLSAPNNVAAQRVIPEVLEHGDMDQKREALLRAALNHVELGHYDDESDWCADARLAGRFMGFSSGEWLRAWDAVWALGFLGGTRESPGELESLYAEFLTDRCGPARWRALVAHQMLLRRDPVVPRSRLNDPFPPARIEAISLLGQFGHVFTADELSASLRSPEDAERWLARVVTRTYETASTEELLADLVRRQPLLPEPSKRERYLEAEYAWESAIREHARFARERIIAALAERWKGEQGTRAFFALVESLPPHLFEVLVEVAPGELDAAEVAREMLASGSLRQRRMAAKLLPWRHQDALLAYLDDSDPEIAALARKSVEPLQARERRRAQGSAQTAPRYVERPACTEAMLSRADSFEALWSILRTHRLSLDGMPDSTFERRPRWKTMLEPEERRAFPDRLSEPERRVLHRLRQLYRPEHRSLLLGGLEAGELQPYAVELLCEDSSVPELLELLRRRDAIHREVVEILARAGHGADGACVLGEELLAGRLPRSHEDANPSAPTSGGGVYFRQRARRERFSHLLELDGLTAFLPLLAPRAPPDLRKDALGFLDSSWREWTSTLRPELATWAREAERAKKTPMRVVALRALAYVGNAEDAARWLRALSRPRKLPTPVLVAAVHLLGRLGNRAALAILRPLIRRQSEVGPEAALALLKLGGLEVLDESLRLLEARPFGRAWGWPTAREWRRALGEKIILHGTGEQARRAAHLLLERDGLWPFALTHLRLPEHVLFLGELIDDSRQRLDEEGYTEEDAEAHAQIQDAMKRVGMKAARRELLRAVLEEPGRGILGPWFHERFEPFIGSPVPEDLDLILDALRKRPDSEFALRWLRELPGGEASLDALWRELRVPWWHASAAPGLAGA